MKIKSFFSIWLLFFFAFSYAALNSVAEAAPALIPRPVELKEQAGTFDWRAATPFEAPHEASGAVTLLKEYFGPLIGDEKTGAPLVFEHAPALAGEAYELEIAPQKVVLRAANASGWKNAIQTLRQLVPADKLNAKSEAAIALPCLQIRDEPRFAWRGLMLDCGRHFFPKEWIKKYLDVMALHKLNVFHWHLTDDQGWRLEIEKYPRLTEIGAWRGKGNQKEGGFYTQADAIEIVRYAASRGIAVVPEIEMPGHSMAALAAYPELSCTGGPFEVPTQWGVKKDVYCAGNEATYEFIENVLDEVTRIFPSEWVHIGGDEVPKDRWKACPKCQALMKATGLTSEHELQSYFVRRVQKMLSIRGKRLIGWDEILEGGLASGAAVMSWRGTAGGIAAAQANADVVMSPNSALYLDYYQSKRAGEPKAIGGFVPLKTVYDYEPVPPELNAAQARHILGAQGNIWGEYIATPDYAEYMTYPRACALAENAWSKPDAKNYDEFLQRLQTHLTRLDALKVNYRKLDKEPTVLGTWKSGETKETYTPREWDISGKISGPGAVKIRFQYTRGAHRLDIEGAEIVADGVVIARDAHTGITGATDKNNVFSFTIPALPANAKILLRANIRSDAGTDSNGEILLEN